MEVSNLEFREMVVLAKAWFKKSQSVTYGRYKLCNRSLERGETLESFHAAPTAQTAKAELGTLGVELVTDQFISRMQVTLNFETFPPNEVLKREL